jgi:rRNA maturation endonuclease Nob1
MSRPCLSRAIQTGTRERETWEITCYACRREFEAVAGSYRDKVVCPLCGAVCEVIWR